MTHGTTLLLITVFVLHHDRVAERQQPEEVWHVTVLAGSDEGHQGVIHELELSIGKLVPAPVNRLVWRKKTEFNHSFNTLIIVFWNHVWSNFCFSNFDQEDIFMCNSIGKSNNIGLPIWVDKGS